MLRLVRPAFAGVLALLWAGVASATPVIFTFESSTNGGGALTIVQTVSPALPFDGTGDIDEALGTYNLTLPDHSIFVDVLGDGVLDARLDITGWGQAGTFAGGVGGGLTGTSVSGALACTDLGGGFGGNVCAGASPTVSMWPPTGAAGLFGDAGATIDIDANTITVNTGAGTGGQLQNVYSYSIVPEPGTMLLLGMGLIGLVASGRRQA